MIKTLSIVLLFSIAGFAGNYYSLPLFLGVNYLFGSIATLTVTRHLGTFWGVVVAIAASSYTLLHWGHPYALITFTAEALFVGTLIRRTQTDIVAADIAFWLLLGMPMTWFFYSGTLHIDNPQALTILFKQPVNGITNAVAAILLAAITPSVFWRNQNDNRNFVSITGSLQSLLISFAVIPAISIFAYQARQDHTKILDEIKQNLAATSHTISNQLTVSVTDKGDKLSELINNPRRLASRLNQSNLHDQFAKLAPSKIVLSDANNKLLYQRSFRQPRGTSGSGNSDRITYSIDLLENQRKLASVSYNLSSQGLLEVFAEFTESIGAKAAIVSENGRVIAATSPDLAPGDDYAHKRAQATLSFADKIPNFLPNEAMPALARWRNSVAIIEPDLDGALLNAHAVIEKPLSGNITELQNVYVKYLGFAFLVSLISALVSAILSRRATDTLVRLVNETSALSNRLVSGRFIEWPKSRISEIRSLTNTLHTMTESLCNQFVEIHEANTQLQTEVSERQQAQATLATEKNRIQTTLDSINEGVITTDPEGIITYMNPVSGELTEWAESEAIGTPINEVFKVMTELGREPVTSPIDAYIHQQDSIGVNDDIIMTSRNGREFSIQSSASAIIGEDSTYRGYVFTFIDISESRHLARQMAYQATHDSLTGLVNRSECERLIKQALKDVKNSDQQHVLCYLDLDQFKVINDTVGHIAGDKLLKQVSNLLLHKIRAADTLARIGGDEFCLLLHSCSLHHAEHIAETLISALNDYRFLWKDHSFSIGVSIGITPISDNADSAVQLLTRADVACYTAKEQGRNRLHIYQFEDDESGKRHNELFRAAALSDAMTQGKFDLYCEPIISLPADGSPATYYEILLRLTGEDGQLVSPGAFIPAAERYNLMSKIDRWVIYEALRRYMSNTDTPPASKMTINLSGTSLNDRDLVSYVCQTLIEFHVPPECVCFEITETAAVSNIAQASNIITSLRDTGCSFSLDDFGSGLSSFNYLKNLPVDFLKIDGHFVRGIANDSVDRAMVAAIHEVGEIMGIKTIAECVENEETLSLLKEIGIDYVQGFLLGRATPFDEVFGKQKQETLNASQSA